MSYENAPATEMLASNCACCARPLVDSQSVETGIGPVCRQKYMVADAVTGEARIEGNKLIHTIAKLHLDGQARKGKEVVSAIARLKELGFAKVVARINKRLRKHKPIELTYQGERLFVKTPYMDEEMFYSLLGRFQKIPGRKWEGKAQGNSFPMDQKRSIYRLLCLFFPGEPAIGPKGEFTIGQVA